MNAKGKKFVSLFLVFSLLALSSNLMAKERRGADLLIQKKDGKQVRGELIAVKQNSLLLKDSESGADESVDIKDVKVIKIVKKSLTYELGIGGFLLGAITLGLLHSEIVKREEVKGEEIGKATQHQVWRTSGLGGVIGSLAGIIIGTAVGIDKTIQIEGKPDSEIKEILEKLRNKARIPEFQ